MIRTDGTLSQWRRDVKAQYPQAMIVTHREGRLVVEARAFYTAGTGIISTWARSTIERFRTNGDNPGKE